MSFFRVTLPLVLAAAALACGDSVITSRAGRLSPGSLNYLRAAFFPDEIDTEVVMRELVELDAHGILADRLGFRKDPSRRKYLLLEKRRRQQKAAYALIGRKLGERFSPADMFAEMQVRPGIEGAVKAISGVGAGGWGLLRSPGGVIVAEWPGGAVTLADLRETMLPEEWDQLLSLGPAPLAVALDEHLKRWAYRAGSERLAREMRADEDELERFDHDHAAELFIAMKYGFAEEGIYPAKIIELSLEPQELMLHFIKIRDRLLPLRRALVSYTAVKDNYHADLVIEGLKKGKTFAELAETHAVDGTFRETAAPHWIGDDGASGTGARAEARRVALNVARRNILEPVKSPARYGVLVVRVLSTERVKKKVRYEDYMSVVKYDLNRDLLRRQFPVDLKDTIDGMRVRIAREKIKQ